MSTIDFIRLNQIEKDLSGYQQSLKPVYNGFQYSDYPIIKPGPDGCDWEIVPAHWEYIPNWVKNMDDMKLIRRGIDPKTGRQGPAIPWLNATGENLLSSKMWRDAALNRRCLVLSTGFYESRHIFPMGKKGKILKTAEKYPYHIYLKDQNYFFMPGIWNNWTDQNTGENMDTFALVTTAANPLMDQIHNSKKRMPTILTEDLASIWIGNGLAEEEITRIATYQYPAEKMAAHLVRKDYKDLDEPYQPHEYEDQKEALTLIL